MSKYTTEVRYMCESYAGLDHSAGYSGIDYAISNARKKIFDFKYPIFDEAYREVLESKILKHYYTREIGMETVSLWKLKLAVRMSEIMPYYNKLYTSELIEFNPMYDVDLKRKRDGKNDENREVIGNKKTDSTSSGTSNEIGSVNSTGKDLYSDTPQGSISNLENETYLTNARKVAGDEVSDRTNVGSGVSSDKVDEVNSTVSLSTEDYLETIKGKQGTQSYSSLLKEYRETFINVDVMIINELGDLFLNLW